MLKKRKQEIVRGLTLLDVDIEKGIVYAGDALGTIHIMYFEKAFMLSRNSIATLIMKKQIIWPKAKPNELIKINTKLQEVNIGPSKKEARYKMIGQRRIGKHVIWYIEGKNAKL